MKKVMSVDQYCFILNNEPNMARLKRVFAEAWITHKEVESRNRLKSHYDRSKSLIIEYYDYNFGFDEVRSLDLYHNE